MKERIVTHIYIKLNGSPLNEEIKGAVQEVVVDQHAYLPHMFTILIFDADSEILDAGSINLTHTIEISVEDEENEKTVLIAKGEITAIEPEFSEHNIPYLLIRGYDKSHRFFRQTKSRTHVNKKDSDIASEIAGEYGLSPQVQSTDHVYDHVFQHNQSDMAFLTERAWRIGYECFVEDGKLYFRKPEVGGEEITLKWGEDLKFFRPRMTLAEQVSEVTVRGWDPKEMQPIIGLASSGKLYPKIGESKDGAAWANDFGVGKEVIADQPVYSQAEAAALAQARLNERSGAFVQAEGAAFRRPDLKPGRVVKLEGLGRRFSGKYLVTQARHVWVPGRAETFFSVRGTRTGLLAEQALNQPPISRWPGLVPAVVTNIADPEKWGRVKVKYPWLSDNDESDWARVVSPGAGNKAGFFMTPAVNDEVIVGFEHGDFNRPYVLGGLWNGKHEAPPPGKEASDADKDKVRVWHSSTGHYMAMHESSGDKKIEVKTAAGHTVLLDDQNKQVEIKTSGGLVITMDDNGRKITIKSTGDVVVEGQMNVNVKAGANMTLEATGNMDIKANGMVNVKGATVNLN